MRVYLMLSETPFSSLSLDARCECRDVKVDSRNLHERAPDLTAQSHIILSAERQVPSVRSILG